MRLFEKTFMLGAATAAHQVEGNNVFSDCWAEEQIPHSEYDEPSLDTVDHYHHYEEDIKLLADAGLNTYRFSIEWARIQPDADTWIEDEVVHYRNVIACCKRNGITPIVTMHHFTSPKWLIRQGGWENPNVIDRFAYYCERLIKEIGDELEYVCTINEANMRLQLASVIRDMMNTKEKEDHCRESNIQIGVNVLPERIKISMKEKAQTFGFEDPAQVHTFLSQCTAEGDLLVMKAHQAAKDAMKSVCPHLKVGLTLSLHDMQSLSGGESYAKKEWEEEFLHYLPFIRNDDFLGVQCYTRKVFDENGRVQTTSDFPKTQMGYEVYPIAVANVVRTVARDFPGDLIITENGIATEDDEQRISFIQDAIKGIYTCLDEGIPLKGYIHWSLLDNFEWQKGFSKKFGLIAVDRETQIRYPKKSLKILGSYSAKEGGNSECVQYG